VRQEVRNKVSKTDSSVRSALRGFGRVAIWTVLGLLLVRGVLAEPSASTPSPRRGGEGVDPASAAFAVRFARAYLADPSAAVLSTFLAEGVRVGAGHAPEPNAGVAQAEVSGAEELGGGRAVLTVAAELRDARTLYLAVPIVRKEAGEVAALGAPSIVAAPGRAGASSSERPRPLAGADAGQIGDLVAKFLPEYLSAGDAGSLSYLLAPGAAVTPLGGAFSLDALTGATQLGSGEGPRRVVIAAARVSDPASGATYPVAYRLEVVKAGGRWYVAGVQGASS
jgi:Conjugative transposon protein TcpC